MYLHTTAALWHARISLGLWSEDTLFFRSTAQACNAFRAGFTLLCNQLVPLPFQPHCKSLPSLDRQTVPCLEHFSIGVASFWGKATRILSTVTFTSAKWTCAFPMIHCRFVHCNYVQKLEKAGVLVVQVADAKLTRQSCHQSNVCATMFLKKLWTLSNHLGSPLNS